MQDFWACLGVLVAVAGLILIRKQLKEATLSRKVQTLTSLFESFQTLEARRARRYIHHLEPVPVAQITPEQLDEHLDKMWEAVAPFDRIGYFLKKEFIHEEEVIPFMWAIVWTSWQKSKHI